MDTMSESTVAGHGCKELNFKEVLCLRRTQVRALEFGSSTSNHEQHSDPHVVPNVPPDGTLSSPTRGDQIPSRHPRRRATETEIP